jgi:putative transposase
MFAIILSLFSSIRQGFRTRLTLQTEILALRHQLLILQRSARSRRVHLSATDRLLWVWLSRLWSGWRSVLVIVKPETVIAWHRRGFRLSWSWKSRHPQGRPSVSREVIDLIRKMSLANPRWGAPRIHGELLKLGLELSGATVAKYMVRHRKPPSQTWRTFLANHRKDLVSSDFFVVPTVLFRVLFVFIILSHERRRPAHVAVTEYPPLKGWPTNCSKPSPGIVRRVTFYEIVMGATERDFVKRQTGWGFGKFSRRLNLLGRTLTSSD